MDKIKKKKRTLKPYQRLHLDLEKLLAAKHPEEKLPSEPTLAKRLGVSRATLREAMRSFEGRGMIRRRQGIGTFVVGSTPVIEAGLEVLESIETLAKRINLKVTMGALEIFRCIADKDKARILEASVGDPLVQIERVIFTDSRPVAFLHDTLTENILTPDELQEGFTGSLLDFIIQRGKPELFQGKTSISAVGATHEIARALQIQRGDVLLLLTSQLFAVDGKVVDYSEAYFIPGYFRFHVLRKLNGSNAK